MAKVNFYTESRYKANRKKIRSQIESVLKNQSVKTPIEVTVAIVGNRKMKSLNKKYRQINSTTDVLSFSQLEKKDSFQTPPSTNLYIGDIIISFPQAVKQAKENNLLVDEEINNLVKHGLLHLLGIHHR